MVLRGGRQDYHFLGFPLPRLEGVVSFKCGRILQVEGRQLLLEAEMVLSRTDGDTPSLLSLKHFL